MKRKVNIIAAGGFMLIILSEFVQFFVVVQGDFVEQLWFTLWEGGERAIVVCAVAGMIFELLRIPALSLLPLIVVLLRILIIVSGINTEMEGYSAVVIWGAGFYILIGGFAMAVIAELIYLKKWINEY